MHFWSIKDLINQDGIRIDSGPLEGDVIARVAIPPHDLRSSIEIIVGAHNRSVSQLTQNVVDAVAAVEPWKPGDDGIGDGICYPIATNSIPYKPGDLVMVNGMLAHLEGSTNPDRFVVNYLKIVTHEGDVDVVVGSVSMWHGREDFKPITDSLLQATASLYETKLRADKAKADLATAQDDAKVWKRVIQVLDR